MMLAEPVTPVASRRGRPWRMNHSMAGSIAMAMSQASRSMKRKCAVAWKVHRATSQIEIAMSTKMTDRRNSLGSKASHCTGGCSGLWAWWPQVWCVVGSSCGPAGA